MKLERVLSMGLDELTDRGRQEMWKLLERVGGNGATGDLCQRVFTELAAAPAVAPIRARARAGDVYTADRMLLESFRDAGPARFFEGAASADAPALLPPGARDQVLAQAEALCRGRFDLLGYRSLHFGDPVDWHLDPVSGRRAPRAHWSRIDPLDAAHIGDHKVIWELNRHQWLVRLGQAYQLTGDERYAEVFSQHVRNWMRANPPGLGINWASSLEVALRLIAWCWALVLFRTSPALSPPLFAKMLGHIWAHASHVERYLSGYFSPNTHLTGEALGLFYAGTVFPDLRAAPRWRALGQRILEAESEAQILPDGVHFELATCYHRYTLEIYLHFLILAARNGITTQAGLAGRVERMLDFLLALRHPDGSVPQIGDADGGCLLPLARRGPDDLRGVFATAAAFFGRTDCAWAAAGPAPETAWLLGPAGMRAFDALAPTPPRGSTSRLFGWAGYIVMRSGWGDDDHQLIFDAGPLGCPVSAGHGHADLLSIQCSLWGTPYIVDPGTCSYRSDLEWRDVFRSTAAHSTVMVDGESQAVPAGPFGWQERPGARLDRWSSTDTTDLADAFHEGYARLPSPMRHRRRVLWVKPRYWVLVDDLEGGAEHEIELRFQFAPLDVTLEPSLWARARDLRGHGLLVRPFSSARLKAEVRVGDLAPIEGWVSHDYGRRRAAPVLIYSAVTRLPLRIVTLLWPIQDGGAAPPDVSPVLDAGSALVGLAFGDDGETIVFRDEAARGGGDP
jgi:heparinase II/III-like protein